MHWLFILSILFAGPEFQHVSNLEGAWQGADGVLILSSGFFAYTEYDEASREFIKTLGGMYGVMEGMGALTYEWDSGKKENVGQIIPWKITEKDDVLQWGESAFERIDDGTPGALRGTWLITGRMRDGEMRTRPPGARKTMKILSGTRFQWIAYNTDTGEFSGTGGGTYETKEGKYVENIAFFSKNPSRVGARLSFEYEIRDGDWHHRGKSSTGIDIHEIWSRR